MITLDVKSPFGLSKMGFMCILGSTIDASACSICAIPISPFSFVVYEFKDMFWDLKGATLYPLFFNSLPNDAAVIPFPSPDTTPPVTNTYFVFIFSHSFL